MEPLRAFSLYHGLRALRAGVRPGPRCAAWRPLRATSCLLAVLVLGAPALSAEFYVAVEGLDAPSCGGLASPCATIQYTLDTLAAAGDYLHVGPGRFTENV